jgi:hypothetical protein
MKKLALRGHAPGRAVVFSGAVTAPVDARLRRAPEDLL